MTEHNVSCWGFISYVRHKLQSGYYANQFNTFRTNCFKWLTGFFVLIVLSVVISSGFIAILYASALLFYMVGFGISLTNNCSIIECISFEMYEKDKKEFILNLFNYNGKHECCACNTSTGHLNYADINGHFMSCNTDGYADYTVTGLFFTIFGSAFAMVLIVIFALIINIIESIYSGIKSQWDEYLDKKTDSRERVIDRKQYTKLDINIKDSNIITPDDIETGNNDEHKYYQTTIEMPEIPIKTNTKITVIEESIVNSSNSESNSSIHSTNSDGCVVINISDFEND